MIINTLPHSVISFVALVYGVADGIARYAHNLAERIDAQPPMTGHRMGAWEVSVSPAARHAVKTMRAAK